MVVCCWINWLNSDKPIEHSGSKGFVAKQVKEITSLYD